MPHSKLVRLGIRATKLKDIIRQRREDLNISRRDVAREVNVGSPEHICMVEQGHRKLDLDRIPALANVLQLPVEELCKIALLEQFPNLYNGLMPNNVMNKRGEKLDIEFGPSIVQAARKLQEMDTFTRMPVIQMIDHLYEQEQKMKQAKISRRDEDVVREKAKTRAS